MPRELAEARARVRLLHMPATLAEIDVSLTQTAKVAAPVQTGMFSNLRSASSDAFQSMLGTLSPVLNLVIWIIAYLPIWGPLLFAAWYASRRWNNPRPKTM